MIEKFYKRSVNMPQKELRKNKGETGLNIDGNLFNLFTPDFDLIVPGNNVFLTIGAFKQTPDHFHAYHDLIDKQRPALYINVKPVVNFLYQDNKIDYMALRCEKSSKILWAYVKAIESLEQQYKVQTQEIVQSYFSNCMLKAFCQIISRCSGS